jgi:CRISPR-associated endonuclease/helicase Cas3
MHREVDQSAWAKAHGLSVPYPLICHLLDTAAIAMALWDRYLTAGQRATLTDGLALGQDEAHARTLTGFWAGIHDIGKLTPAFARCDEAAWGAVSSALRRDEGDWDAVRHDAAGMRTVPDLLAEFGYGVDPLGDDVGWKVAQIVGGHHGCYQSLDLRHGCSGPLAAAGLGGPTWADQRVAHIRLVDSVLGSPEPPRSMKSSTAVLITGLVILADWLASQEHFIAARQADPAPDPAEHFARSQQIAGPLIEEAGLDGSALAWKPFDFLAAFGISDPNPLQRSIAEQLPAASGRGAGILVVTTSMGDGKTELALCAERILAAHTKSDGFYLGLPTMATSDHMYHRIRDYADLMTTGPAAVTLAHSMAWLNEAYQESILRPSGHLVTGDADGPVRRPARTAASQWLRGSKRPMLARIGVGTFDQALAAVLPVRHNALRLLALSGRTLVIDEAHACDPYMQVLLQRLLTWLAEYGCSVILLSATLPGSTVDRYVSSYLRGSGHSRNKLARERYVPGYPGWIYVDAKSATVTTAAKQYVDAQSAARETKLAVEVRHVRHHAYPAVDDHGGAKPLPKRSRYAEIGKMLQPLVESGGTAAVVCTTVADAQQTYAYVRDVVFADDPDADSCVRLLHAKFPAGDRESATREIVAALGKDGPRPERMVVVATQVIEQSLDLDVDLLISDLAPISLLLQRAGRCWRHEKRWASGVRPRPRPAWSAGPRLVVLVPSDEDDSLVVPRAWGSVYHPYLLEATTALLAERAGALITLPGDVQDLVERVYGEGTMFADLVDDMDSGRQTRRLGWEGEILAQRGIAQDRVIPRPSGVTSLALLHDRGLIEDEDIGTRLGVDSVRVVCCYRQPGSDGKLTLDPQGETGLPEPDAHGRFSAAQVRAVMARTIPVSATILAGRGAATDVPKSWMENPWLAELVLLPHQQDRAGVWRGPTVGRTTFRLDDRLGLVTTR